MPEQLFISLRILNFSKVCVIFFLLGCGTSSNRAEKEKTAKSDPTVSSRAQTKVGIYADTSIYFIYTVAYPTQPLSMHWQNDTGEPLLSFDALKRQMESRGKKLLFATNAGMYIEEFSPLGLYVEGGVLKNKAVYKKGLHGNFYLQPNGVFLLTRRNAKVVTTDEYRSVKDTVLYATQSGPMLVIDGELNNAFTKGSLSTNIRNGVGINKKGEAVFAISNRPVNFWDFASLFRDSLHCRNALYLDGAISRMYLPSAGRNDLGGDFGAIIAAAE